MHYGISMLSLCHIEHGRGAVHYDRSMLHYHVILYVIEQGRGVYYTMRTQNSESLFAARLQ